MGISRGQVVWYDPHPTVGAEQFKRRPWVVVSPNELTRRGLVVICAITSQPTQAHDPTLQRWCVELQVEDLRGDDLEPGWILVHQTLTRAVQRFAPRDWTNTYVTEKAMSRFARVSAEFHGFELPRSAR